MDDDESVEDISEHIYSHKHQAHSIRHISGIYIRNLTPFPQRDHAVSALDHHLASTTPYARRDSRATTSDDLDLTFPKNRLRRISSTSTATLPSQHSGDAIHTIGADGDSVPRLRTLSSYKGHSSSISSQPSITRRLRSSSNATSTLDHSSILQQDLINQSTMSSRPSQRDLERVVSSRLFETFITLNAIPPPPPQSSTNPSSTTTTTAQRPSRPRTVSGSASRLRGFSDTRSPTTSTTTATKPQTLQRGGDPKGLRNTPSPTASIKSRPEQLRSQQTHMRAASSSSSLDMRSSKSSPSSAAAGSKLSTDSSSTQSVIPFFISSVHSPSTNPAWEDLEPTVDFAFPEVDLKDKSLIVKLWGRRSSSYSSRNTTTSSKLTSTSSTSTVKGKERQFDKESSSQWQEMASWELNLGHLQPFAPDFTSTSEDLAPNSLIIKLASTGSLYHVPPRSRRRRRRRSRSRSSLDSRTSSVERAHNVSDGEVDTVKASASTFKDKSAKNANSRRSFELARNEAQRRSLRETKMKRGATLDSTIQVLNLQRSVAETEGSLSALIESIDGLIQEDGVLGLVRGVEELTTSLGDHRQEFETSKQSCAELRDAIARKKGRLKERRDMLSMAAQYQDEDIIELDDLEERIESEQSSLTTLIATQSTERSLVVRSLERIFPIEPLSPADLLFSIVSIPLPIPSNPSDPAPPLNLSVSITLPPEPSSNQDKDKGKDKKPATATATTTTVTVTEEGVATALGFVAQVVHMLSVYLRCFVPYPITCAGSRSVIRDPISMMHGPRTFPLYSKGVDTYRFEYAVFLLNKDIEMLMTHQNVQTLDMRHTLPNLKNLLLTLTSNLGEDEDHHVVPSASSSAISSQTPSTGTGMGMGMGIEIPPMLTISTSSPAEQGSEDVDEEDANGDGDAPTTPTASHPNPQSTTSRLNFLAPVMSNFWSRRSPSSGGGNGNSGSNTLGRASTPPSLPDMPEDADAGVEESSSGEGNGSEVVSTAVDEPPENGNPNSTTSEHSNSPIAASDDTSSIHSIPKSTSESSSHSHSHSRSTSASEDNTGDTETIKDGSAGRGGGGPQSGWLAKAFFGQQVEDHHHYRGRRERGGEKVGAGVGGTGASPRRRNAAGRAVSTAAAVNGNGNGVGVGVPNGVVVASAPDGVRSSS